MSTYDGHMARSRSISRARMRVVFAETKKQDNFSGEKTKSKAMTTADRTETRTKSIDYKVYFQFDNAHQINADMINSNQNVYQEQREMQNNIIKLS